MRVILIFLIFLTSISLTDAQPNLVPNSSFEDYYNLNANSTNLQDFILDWYWGLGYFHTLCLNQSFAVPENDAGHQYPRTGNAYCGIYTYAKSSVPSLALRNYIQIKLNANLVIGKKYKVKFYISLGDSMHASNNSIGAYFAPDSLLTYNNGVIELAPQIENDVSNDLSSKTDWTLVTDTFVATGNERWMTIGNFRTDSLSEIYPLDSVCDQLNSFNCASYYYIDDVSVMLIDETGMEEQKHNKFSLYPNPNNGCFRLQYDGTLMRTTILRMTDIFGNQLDQIEIINSMTEYEKTRLTSGLYFYTIRQGSEELVRGKFMVID